MSWSVGSDGGLWMYLEISCFELKLTSAVVTQKT